MGDRKDEPSARLAAAVFHAGQEQDCRPLVRGTLPAGLDGTYFLNGPAGFSAGPRRHWLDGDGLVRALRLRDGQARFRSRFVATEKRRREQAAGLPLFRTFGHAFAGDALRKGLALESPANVSAYPQAGHLLASGEQSRPWLLNPADLETAGECDFQGSLTGLVPLSAHPKWDPARGRMVNFGVTYFGGRGKLSLYVFDAANRLVQRGQALLGRSNVIHDFALSGRFACFRLCPYLLDIRAFVKGGLSLQEALRWEAETSGELLIFDCETADLAARIPLERSGFCLHLVTAFEEGDELVIDLVETDRPFYDRYRAEPWRFGELPQGTLVRYRMRTGDWRLKHIGEFAAGFHFDFPSIAPRLRCRPYDRFWVLGMTPGAAFYDRVSRFCWREQAFADSWQAPSGRYLGGEPCFLDNAGDGLVICQWFASDATASGYCFFDAARLAAGPVAELELAAFDPTGFHSSFQPATPQPTEPA